MHKITIPTAILKELSRIKHAECLLLTGSRVLGKPSPNSDWDIFVVLKKGQKRWRKTYQVEGEWLELMCNDETQIRREFADDLTEGRGITMGMFATGQILQDNPTKTLKKLTTQAKRYWVTGPKPLSRSQLNWINYDIATYLQDLEDCLTDRNEAHLLSSQAVNEFVRYYYRLSGKWLPRPKDRLKNFAAQTTTLHALVTKYNRSTKWQQQSQIAIQLGRKLIAKFHLKADGSLHIPPSAK